MTLPQSPACERNNEPILEQLRDLLSQSQHVFEVGSGTGQHAVHFAPALPHLIWQTSDLACHHAGIQAWLNAKPSPNLRKPINCDLNQPPKEIGTFDTLFTANTLHIISWSLVKVFFNWIPKVLSNKGLVVVYGPFNEMGAFTSESNQQFDKWLKERDPLSGIRNRQDIMALAKSCNLVFKKQIRMPANNQILVWSYECGT